MGALCFPNRRRFGAMALGLGAAAMLPAAGAAGAAGVRAHLPLVLIDPGHGGHDPGAIAPDGVFEKTITLASGFALRRSLLATGRYRVAMTRTSDVFISLETRVAMTVAAGADLFIALHCDHLPDPKMRGASIFTLSAQASDGLAASVAQDENSADKAEGGGMTGVSPQVAGILASLETRATRINAAMLAQDIFDSFTGFIDLLEDPLRSANFAVLRDASTPSTLLEMGCLTNPLDEALLKNPAHRQLMAARLTRAVDVYFSKGADGREARLQG
jgi:N-acetylmuramoyl-L-alanine amidase